MQVSLLCRVEIKNRNRKIMKKENSLSKNPNISTNHQNICHMQKEMPAYTCRRAKGSFTVETAVVLPVFTCFMVGILFFFCMLQTGYQIQEALYKTARELAVEAGKEESDIESTFEAEVYFQKHIKKSQAVKRHVEGGRLGINLKGSDISGDHIELTAYYQVHMPVAMFGKQSFMIVQRVKYRKWIGAKEGGSQDNETLVYITKTGHVYHITMDCTYLKPKSYGTREAEKLRNDSGGKYYPCKICTGEQKPEEVYITVYGNRYHANAQCSEIYRDIQAISIKNAGGRSPCTKCGKAKKP